MKTKDLYKNNVEVGSRIKVLSIDDRILEYLPEEERNDLRSFVGEVFEVEDINSDGSMVVSKSWELEGGEQIMGHSIAIFPDGAELSKE